VLLTAPAVRLNTDLAPTVESWDNGRIERTTAFQITADVRLRQSVDQARTAGPSLGVGSLAFASLLDGGWADACAVPIEMPRVLAIICNSRAQDPACTQRLAGCGE
jgi:hypothetical protein